MPALWLGDVGVLAAVRPHDTEVPPGEHLAQVPHPVHARERDSYDGGKDRAAWAEVLMGRKDTLAKSGLALPKNWSELTTAAGKVFVGTNNERPRNALGR